MALNRSIVPGASVFSYNGSVETLKHSQGKLTYLGPDFVWENDQYHRLYTNKLVSIEDARRISRDNYEYGLSPFPHSYILCNDFEGYIFFVDSEFHFSTNLLDLIVIDTCPWLDIETCSQITHFITSSKFYELIEIDVNYSKIENVHDKIRFLQDQISNYYDNLSLQLIFWCKKNELKLLEISIDIWDLNGIDTYIELLNDRFTRSLLLYISKRFRDLPDSMFYGLDKIIGILLEPMSRRYSNVFSYRGKIDQLLDNKYGTYLVYHGPIYKRNKLVFENKNILYEEIEDVLNINYELLNGDPDIGILIAEDFEGKFIWENNKMYLSLNELKHDLPSQIASTHNGLVGQKVLDDLDDDARKALVQFTQAGKDYGAEDTISLINELMMTYSYPPLIRAQLLLNKALWLQQLGKPRISEVVLDQVRALYNAIEDKSVTQLPLDQLDYHIPQRIMVLSMMNEHLLYNYDSASQLAREIIDTWNRSDDPPHEVLVNAFTILGSYEVQKYNFTMALDYYEEALQHSGAFHPKNRDYILLNIANCHMKLEQFDLAYEYLLDAEQIGEEHYPSKSLRSLMIEEIYGRYFLHENHDQARVHFKQALQLTNEIKTSVTYQESILINLIFIELIAEDYTKVMEYYEQFSVLIEDAEVAYFQDNRELLEAILSALGILPHRNDSYSTLYDMFTSDDYGIIQRVQAATFLLRFLSEKENKVVDEIGLDKEDILDELHKFATKYQLRSLRDVLEEEFPLEHKEEIMHIIKTQISLSQMRETK